MRLKTLGKFLEEKQPLQKCFREKATFKAKKYLSSIKCLGLPLKAYVESGELKDPRYYLTN